MGPLSRDCHLGVAGCSKDRRIVGEDRVSWLLVPARFCGGLVHAGCRLGTRRLLLAWEGLRAGPVPARAGRAAGLIFVRAGRAGSGCRWASSAVFGCWPSSSMRWGGTCWRSSTSSLACSSRVAAAWQNPGRVLGPFRARSLWGCRMSGSRQCSQTSCISCILLYVLKLSCTPVFSCFSPVFGHQCQLP